MHCFKDNINNRKYFLHFIRLLLPPKLPILPNLGGSSSGASNQTKIPSSFLNTNTLTQRILMSVW